MSNTVIVEIADPLAEMSDYLVTATLVGPDGSTPVEPAAVSSILMTLRDLESNTLLFTDRNVTPALTAGGAFSTLLSASDVQSTVSRRFQRRLLTIKLTQTNGRMRNHAVRFVIENLVDVG